MADAVRKRHQRPFLAQPPAYRGTSEILDGPGLTEESAHRLAPARGALFGVLLGVGSWAAIFAWIASLKH